MTDWQSQAAALTAAGVITATDAETLKTVILADGRISHAEAEGLLDLHRKVPVKDAAFTRFLFDFMKRVVLVDGAISVAEAAWLRSVLFHDGKLDPAERALLKELKDAVLVSCPAFDAMWTEHVGI
jgi:uncharacterized tellurite resistance protein B-like protein